MFKTQLGDDDNSEINDIIHAPYQTSSAVRIFAPPETKAEVSKLNTPITLNFV